MVPARLQSVGAVQVSKRTPGGTLQRADEVVPPPSAKRAALEMVPCGNGDEDEIWIRSLECEFVSTIRGPSCWSSSIDVLFRHVIYCRVEPRSGVARTGVERECNRQMRLGRMDAFGGLVRCPFRAWRQVW